MAEKNKNLNLKSSMIIGVYIWVTDIYPYFYYYLNVVLVEGSGSPYGVCSLALLLIS